MLPPVGHLLPDFQSQAYGSEVALLCWLPSGQAPVAQLDMGQHLQVFLSQRSVDQGSA